MLERLRKIKKQIEEKYPELKDPFIQNKIVGGRTLFGKDQEKVAFHIYENNVARGRRSPNSSSQEQMEEDYKIAEEIMTIQQLRRIINAFKKRDPRP